MALPKFASNPQWEEKVIFKRSWKVFLYTSTLSIILSYWNQRFSIKRFFVLCFKIVQWKYWKSFFSAAGWGRFFSTWNFCVPLWAGGLLLNIGRGWLDRQLICQCMVHTIENYNLRLIKEVKVFLSCGPQTTLLVLFQTKVETGPFF
jgi:hypothetical protein